MVPARVLVFSPSRCGMHLGLSRAVSSRVPGVRRPGLVSCRNIIPRAPFTSPPPPSHGSFVAVVREELVADGLGAKGLPDLRHSAPLSAALPRRVAARDQDARRVRPSHILHAQWQTLVVQKLPRQIL